MTEETKAKMERVEELKRSGLTTVEAAKQVKMPIASYYTARHAAKKLKRKRIRKPITITTIAHAPAATEKLFMLSGSPEQIAEVMRRLS